MLRLGVVILLGGLGTFAAAGAAPAWGPLELLGARVEPGTSARLYWRGLQSFSGGALRVPVMAMRGARAGPTLCLTAAVHGDELNGIEIVRRTFAAATPDELRGTLIGVPIVNQLGFLAGSRYLPDRTDLNRFFPGHPRGNTAARMAHGFFHDVVAKCERLVDLHTGSFKRTNLPQLRANLRDPAVREFITHFGATAVLHRGRERGTLRDAATKAGIPAVTLELGEPATVQIEHVRYGVKAIATLLEGLDMHDHAPRWREPQPIYYRARWLRAVHGGILNSSMALGTDITAGERLGKVVNPLTNEAQDILAPYSGRILGRAQNQFVMPGVALFHIGIEAPPDALDALLEGNPGIVYSSHSAHGRNGSSTVDE